MRQKTNTAKFPFLFGGAFIEAFLRSRIAFLHSNFPSFSEGLSLRLVVRGVLNESYGISLPFRGGAFIEATMQ